MLTGCLPTGVNIFQHKLKMPRRQRGIFSLRDFVVVPNEAITKYNSRRAVC